MVTITTKHSLEEKELCIAAKGHAGYAEAGKDIVCASVSTLMYTLAQSVWNMYSLGSLADEPTIELTEGDACLKCRFDNYDTFIEAFQNFSLIELGYSLLAQNYPQYVSLEDLT
jgi:uncharacterized protein YsxB (DUF464 family)